VAGNLYGTAIGTVFKLDTTGKETILYSFKGGAEDGGFFVSGLVRDAAGNLYGTTQSGGQPNCGLGFGCGVVFKLDKDGNETVLYSFTGGTDGGQPISGLVLDAAGSVYGTTYRGGDPNCGLGSGCGTVFKVDASGNETTLYRFGGDTGGANPLGSLIRNAAGYIWVPQAKAGPSAAAPYSGWPRTAQRLCCTTSIPRRGQPLPGCDSGCSGQLLRHNERWGDDSCHDVNGCGTVFKIASVVP